MCHSECCDRFTNKLLALGRGGGQVVSVLAFYSDDPSSNLAEIYSFFCNIVFEKNENKTKRGQGWSISWKNKLWVKYYSFGSENFTHAYLRVSLFSSQKSLFINLILQQKNILTTLDETLWYVFFNYIINYFIKH